MMNELPKDVLKTIRGYASDKYEPSPSARLIKTLNFEYKETPNEGSVYHPYRLEVTPTESHFNYIKFTSPLTAEIWSTPTRWYIISDLLPSYWSFCANTMDRDING